MPRSPRGGEALAGQLELCLLSPASETSIRPHSQPGSLKPGLGRPSRGRQASMQEVDTRQQGGCRNYFSNQCLVYDHFVNWGGGRGGIIYF